LDRGDSVDEPLARTLGAALGVAPEDARLRESLPIVRGQVEALATEGDIATYVGTLFPTFGQPLPNTTMLRLLATALWHIVKAGELRDHARSSEGERQMDARS
jgi:hypothetical protein